MIAIISECSDTIENVSNSSTFVYKAKSALCVIDNNTSMASFKFDNQFTIDSSKIYGITFITETDKEYAEEVGNAITTHGKRRAIRVNVSTTPTDNLKLLGITSRTGNSHLDSKYIQLNCWI